MITASSVIISEGVGGGGGGGDTAWSSLTSAVSSLTLANGTNATTFNQTSAVTWEWANTTAATSGASQSSPIMELAGQYWTGSVSATDDWTIQNVIGTGTNGTSILTFAHTGSSGTASIQLGSALNVTNGGTVATSASGSYDWGGRSKMFSPADGSITLTPTAGSGNAFTRLQFGGTTASFPAIQVSGAGLVAELADGSAQTTFGATIFNAGTGFQVAGAATSANVLRGNGTNFVSAALAAADLSNGVTGSGSVVLATAPTVNGLTFPTAAGGAVVTQTVGSGTQALGTSLIASGAAATIITTAVTGVLATDNLLADFSADPTSTTGYAPSASGMLTIIKFCTAGHINFYVVNNTGASITPGAVTLNWRVVR